MNFARFAERIDGLQYVADKMELSGSRVRRYLMQSTFCSNGDVLNSDFDILQKALDILSDPDAMPGVMQLRHLFAQVHDIQGTLHTLSQRHTLDEVELFEIKYFATLCSDFRNVCALIGFPYENPEDLPQVRELLDPHGTGTVSFQLYDCYSQSLSQARALARSTDPEKEPETWNTVQDTIQKEELAVREMLSQKLNTSYQVLRDNFDRMARIEIWFAKADLAVRYEMVRPDIVTGSADDQLHIEGMINPQIADILGTVNKTFQPVSITLTSGPCLLTGANMSGKTVVLKTLALIQTLAQFSFFVPARRASIPLVKDVFLVIGDKQDQYRGLSSFAAEMLQLDRIMAVIRKGTRLLLLVDEPARTTNPVEGAAILCALVDFLERYRTMSLVSTHYGDLGLSCRKLRVSGFDTAKVQGRLDPLMMNDYMDYSLTEDKDGSVPMEALPIARLLGVDDSFIGSAQKYVKRTIK